MSLTSFLERNADVRDYFRRAFLKPVIPSTLVVVPPRTSNYSLVGTAFDYLVRLMVRKVNPTSVTERERWVADSAIQRLPADQQQKGQEIVLKARGLFHQFLCDDNLSDDVLTASVELAQLDTVFRTGRYTEFVGHAAHTDDITDLRNLVAAIPLDHFKAKKICIMNPTFGEASVAIGGADADLVIDDLLLDIKATKKQPISTDDFHTLVGYYILYRIGGITGVKKPPTITRVGLYFARHRLFTTWDIADLVGATPLSETIGWLQERLQLNATPKLLNRSPIKKLRPE